MIKFKQLYIIGDDSAQTDEIINCHDLHSVVYEQPPQINLRREFFWATNVLVTVVGGRGSRPLIVTCILSHDVELDTAVKWEEYMLKLDKFVGAKLELEISLFPDPDNNDEPSYVKSFEHCIFTGFERVKTDPAGGVPRLNFVPPPVGPSGPIWMYGHLHFEQVAIDDSIIQPNNP